MAVYTTIDDPSAYFQTALYTGTGSSQSITNDGNSDLQPDWVWTKTRGDVNNHAVFDSTRGVQKYILPNANNSEDTAASTLTAFNSNGFTGGGSGLINGSSRTYVAWQWKANGGTTSSNTDGSITSTVQANTTAGFSIVTYTGNGTNGAFVGHGLGVTPNIVIIKNRSAADAWRVGFSAFSNDLVLNDTSASAAYSAGRIGDLSSTKFELGGSGSFDSTNVNGENYVAYCFAPIQGYSKFGSYTGNGSQDGTFVYTGFKPAFILAKRTDAAKNWYIADSTRSPSNITKAFLSPNLSNAEDTSGDSTDAYFDILSNGFKMRQDFSHLNASGSTQIYMAFAEHPFVSSEGVPATAR